MTAGMQSIQCQADLLLAAVGTSNSASLITDPEPTVLSLPAEAKNEASRTLGCDSADASASTRAESSSTGLAGSRDTHKRRSTSEAGATVGRGDTARDAGCVLSTGQKVCVWDVQTLHFGTVHPDVTVRKSVPPALGLSSARDLRHVTWRLGVVGLQRRDRSRIDPPPRCWRRVPASEQTCGGTP